MGVKGLWKILKTVSQPVPLESLEGKTLAVDVSIWLHQALKAGNDAPQAHLLVLFHRICKLLFCRIRPIFVFDGVMPKLKMVALEKRRKQQSLTLKKAQKNRKAYLDNLAKKRAVEAHLGLTDDIQSKESSSAVNDFQNQPVIPVDVSTSEDETEGRPVEYIEDYVPMRNNVSSEGEEEGVDIDGMDIDSEAFSYLPKEVQHEIIREKIKEKKSRHNFIRCQFPEEDEAFSKFQFNRLLEKGALSRRLDVIRRDMVQRDVTSVTETLSLPSHLTDTVSSQTEGVLARRIVSQDEGHVILWKLKPTSVEESVEEEVENVESIQEKNDMEKSIQRSGSVHQTEVQSPVSTTALLDIACDGEPSEQTVEEDRICIRGALDYSGLESKLNWATASSGDEEAEDAENLGDQMETEDASHWEQEGDLVDAVRTVSSRLLASVSSSMRVPEGEPLKNATAPVIPVIPLIPAIENPSTHMEDEFVTHEVNPVIEINESLSSSDSGSSEWEEVPELPLPKEPQSEPHITSPELLPITVEKEKPLIEKEELLRIEADVKSWQKQIHGELDALSREEGRLRQQTGNPINDRYVEDAKQLMRLFGIPFMVSPQEAEAQCAKLEELRLCDGVITEDSDVWLFGAHRVYKNMFRLDKYVEAHDASVIDKRLGLNRSRLIAIGLMCGTDYTEGVPSVGPVSAMEVLAEFPSDNGFDSLQDFASWYREMKQNRRSTLVPVRKRMLKCDIPSSFPSRFIYDAYVSPQVDDSGDVFSWAKPDLHLLRDYVKHHFGWNQQRADDTLMPIIRRLDDKSVQPKITSFFYVSPQKMVDKGPASGSSSNRMNKAIYRLNKPSSEEPSSSIVPSATKRRDRKPRNEKTGDNAEKKAVKRKSNSSTDEVPRKAPTKTTGRARRRGSKKPTAMSKSSQPSGSLNLSEVDSEEEIEAYMSQVDLSKYL